jgi:hypothetical protein
MCFSDLFFENRPKKSVSAYHCPDRQMGNREEAASSATTAITHLTPRGKALELDSFYVEILYTFLSFKKNR